jgi:hypothetical protein
MNRTVRAVMGGILVVGGLAGLGALSRAPYAWVADQAVLRLAWRARSVQVEVCRHRSAEELERLPVHMREDEVCEGRLLPYRLRAVVDSELVIDAVVHPAGARADRPIYVFREVPLDSGERRLQVRFERQGIAPIEPPEEHPEEHGPARVAPPVLALDTAIRLGQRDVLLVTYDEQAQQLVLRRSSP